MRSLSRVLPACVLALFILASAGCASGGTPFRPVSLRGDLDPDALARYQQEMAAIPGADLRRMMTLESTNHWPLGLLAYWRKGVVEAVLARGGAHVFVVSESRGYGPLSAFYVKRQSATFDQEGRRLATHDSTGVLWGHLLRTDVLQVPGPGGRWLMDGSVHALLDLFNWRGTGQGPAAFWLFSAPSPIGWGG